MQESKSNTNTHDYFHNISSMRDIIRSEKPLIDIHSHIYNQLNGFHKTNKVPNIIFHGVSGSGKRTIVNTFLNTIYNSDKYKLKNNVMHVNCAHGKGIKFIRDELKFFAKTNVQMNTGVFFKTIVLMNADYLTIDAQSALRRCIELFSHNTRFFIILENKHKLLNPILSRFCVIYVPEHIVNGKIINLHGYSINARYQITLPDNTIDWLDSEITKTMSISSASHDDYTELIARIYEYGLSGLDVMKWVENTDSVSHHVRVNARMYFDKIKSEFRCEKLLMLCIFDFLFMRQNKDLKSLASL